MNSDIKPSEPHENIDKQKEYWDSVAIEKLSPIRFNYAYLKNWFHSKATFWTMDADMAEHVMS
jgi:hypothetical protein